MDWDQRRSQGIVYQEQLILCVWGGGGGGWLRTCTQRMSKQCVWFGYTRMSIVYTNTLANMQTSHSPLGDCMVHSYFLTNGSYCYTKDPLSLLHTQTQLSVSV